MLQSPSVEMSFTIDQPVVAPAGVDQPVGRAAQLGGNVSAARAPTAASAARQRNRTAASLMKVPLRMPQGSSCPDCALTMSVLEFVIAPERLTSYLKFEAL